MVELLSKTMQIAYLTTQYPAVSHTFIRRELLEIERRGHSALRLAIRPSQTPPVDPSDRDELTKTLHCLAQHPVRFALEVVKTLLSRPLALMRALGLALRMGWRSDRGVLRHFAYLAEAAFLFQVLKQHAVEHVHVHFGTNAAAVARLIRRLGGPTYSMTVHGPDEFDAPQALDIAGKVADAAFVVAISHFCAAQLRRWVDLTYWSRIHVVHCTVGDDFLNCARPVDPCSRTLLCVGRLCPQKGQLLLLEAFASAVARGSEARLVFAGDGELRASIERRAQTLGVRDRIDITGWVEEAEVRRRLLDARALVLPSFAEGLPMVVMEAFALCRPVISTYVAGIPELVRHGENGWLAPAGDVAALTRAIEEAVAASPERLGAMGAAGRQAVLAHYRTCTEVDRLEELLQLAIADRRAALTPVRESRLIGSVEARAQA